MALRKISNMPAAYSTESLSFRYGLSHNSEIYLSVPMHYMRPHDAYGTDTSGFHLGWLVGSGPLGWTPYFGGDSRGL